MYYDIIITQQDFIHHDFITLITGNTMISFAMQYLVIEVILSIHVSVIFLLKLIYFYLQVYHCDVHVIMYVHNMKL